MDHYSNFILYCIKSLDGVMVSTLDSHPADPGSIPLSSSYFFLFSLVISRKNLVLSIKKSKTQLKNCSFNFIILSFLCMHISHIMKKRSHKVWVISVCYRFILEQCVTNNGSNNCDQKSELDYQGKENYLRKTIQ